MLLKYWPLLIADHGSEEYNEQIDLDSRIGGLETPFYSEAFAPVNIFTKNIPFYSATNTRQACNQENVVGLFISFQIFNQNFFSPY